MRRTHIIKRVRHWRIILRATDIAGTRIGGTYMAQGSLNHKDKMYSQIQEQYGKLVYTYTCQWKTADHLQKTSKIFKWVQIILSAISAGGCLAAVVTDQAQLAWIGGIVSTLLLVVSGYLKDKDFAAEQKEYRSAATKLWMIREEYISLLTDFESLDEQEIEKKREELVKKTAKIYETAPQTDSKSYKEAQDALKNKEEQFFTQQELNVILPMHLRKDT